MSLLKVEHLDKELGPQKSLILKDISFTIEEGEFVSLIGKSGSGKSTLLYAVSTLDFPTRGKVFYSGKDITLMDSVELHRLRNRDIGFIFQFHYLLPELSALDNILMPARKADMLEEKTKFGKFLLESFGLKDRMNHLPRELSGGEAQRVAIARALIMEPKFLFADEPTGSLDTANSEAIFNLFQKINKELKTTIIMVTHDPDLAGATSRQIHLIDGQIVSADVYNRK